MIRDNFCILCTGRDTVRVLPLGGIPATVNRDRSCVKESSRECLDCARNALEQLSEARNALEQLQTPRQSDSTQWANARGIERVRLVIYVGMLAAQRDWDMI